MPPTRPPGRAAAFLRNLRHTVLPPDEDFDVTDEEYYEDVVDSFDELPEDNPIAEGDESEQAPGTRGRPGPVAPRPLRRDEYLG